MRCREAWHALPIILMGLALGCQNNPQTAPSNKGEDQAREAFTDFQVALKARDADKLWALLDTQSQEDAERVAKVIKEAYTKSGAEEKAHQEEALGLTDTELSSLSGRGFLKTKRFQGKYEELRDSKIDKITVQGDTATVMYIEPDGDRERLTLVRQDGRWKLTVPMPKGALP
jgi:hypothetical protein